ncbi:serine/threonine-protein kinase [Cryptosporangium japonicum]|uniref:non-specific serine/threonine protein kinase n=1 Tax=Cryptosporangium japonicum TaxID=80872 RepID=A0ABN0UXW2_9ACTN
MSEQRTVDGRYRLDKAVGSGGMGVVWRAFDLRLGRVVAVKEVRFPSAMSDDERDALTKRAMLEAQSAGRLDHPNIVPVHDVILEGEQPFIIMRFVEGRSLDQTVSADGPLPDRVVARIGVQLLDALGAAHAADVIHRDVKPHNVLIQTDGTAQLTDFSIASVFGTETLTKTGALLGSPGYIAPERLMTGATTPGGDLFALGATLFFAVEGIGPFVAKETIVGLFASATQPHPRPKFAGPRLTRVIDGLLEKKPEERLDRPEARALLLSIAETPEESETRSGEFVPPPPGRVDTDDRVGRGAAAVPGLPQGDLPSDNSTAVFAVREQSRPLSRQSSNAPSSGAPSSGAPVSGGVVYGRPISGAPVSGAPSSGGAVYGRPISGAPVSGGVVYGRPISGAPVSGAPISGAPSSGAPSSGAPWAGVPTSGVPVTGARELGWGPGGGPSSGHDSGHGNSGHGNSGHGNSGHGNSGHGNSGHGGPPTFRPSAVPTSPPAGQRWKRLLAVVTIIVLGLGAGIIANLIATTQDRSSRANRAGTNIEEVPTTGNDTTPTTPPSPGAEMSDDPGAKPVPTGTRPQPTPTTSSPGPGITSEEPPEPKVLSASLSVQQPTNPVDCANPLAIAITVNVKTTGALAVEWAVSRGGTTVASQTRTVGEKDTGFSVSPLDTMAKPAAGAHSYSLSIKAPNAVSAGPETIEIKCAQADPGGTNTATPNAFTR